MGSAVGKIFEGNFVDGMGLVEVRLEKMEGDTALTQASFILDGRAMHRLFRDRSGASKPAFEALARLYKLC